MIDTAPRRQPEPPAEATDLAGLIDELIRRGADRGSLQFDDYQGKLAGTIQKLARQNPNALAEGLFESIIAFTGLLLVRCQLRARYEIARADRNGPSRAIPDELLRDGWLDRIERISRFVAEMSALRARVQHLGRLGTADGRSGRNHRPPAAAPAVDGGPPPA